VKSSGEAWRSSVEAGDGCGLKRSFNVIQAAMLEYSTVGTGIIILCTIIPCGESIVTIPQPGYPCLIDLLTPNLLEYSYQVMASAS